jgi:hypothetical protein
MRSNNCKRYCKCYCVLRSKGLSNIVDGHSRLSGLCPGVIATGALSVEPLWRPLWTLSSGPSSLSSLAPAHMAHTRHNVLSHLYELCLTASRPPFSLSTRHTQAESAVAMDPPRKGTPGHTMDPLGDRTPWTPHKFLHGTPRHSRSTHSVTNLTTQ